MMQTSGSLYIKDIELEIFLGWPDDERAEKQLILVDFLLNFSEPPKGCETDALQDTHCYSKLIEIIRAQIADKHFHLIEHLAKFLYELLKAHYPAGSTITVSVTKRPKILDFRGTVCFSYGDKP